MQKSFKICLWHTRRFHNYLEGVHHLVDEDRDIFSPRNDKQPKKHTQGGVVDDWQEDMAAKRRAGQ